MRKRPLISKPTKKTLMHIKQHPGIRYRQLLRLSGFANGVLSFHLNKLKKFKIVRAKKVGYSTTRYYPTAIKTAESDILDHLLHSTQRKIIFFLLEHSNCRFKEIVQHIERAPSTTSFQLQRLENTGIISVMRVDKNNQFYRLKNRSRIIKTISKYKITR
ncbi:MAG TPA: ArsR family transcriptional regulator [Nitrososphaeraceae archaeon]|nr:ArsR family transcriptional regulator [Nitrososphaeraceae archaeon]